MNKTAFKKLKVGQKVSVTGKQDSKTFRNERGVIQEKNHDYVCVKFDTWAVGPGPGGSSWCFYDYDAKGFTITETPEAPKVDPVKPDAPVKKRPHGAQEYKGNGKHDWQIVTRDADEYTSVTERLRVPGGWLYRTASERGVPTMTFVPVPQAVGYAV